MIKDLKNEMNDFIQSLEDRIKDKNDLQHLKDKANHLLEAFANELERVIKYKADEIKRIEERQQQSDEKLEEMELIIKNIAKDIYEEYEDFEIICPYCNFEFDSEVDETISEVICPECGNSIELDWETDVDESECDRSCSSCNHDEDEK